LKAAQNSDKPPVYVFNLTIRDSEIDFINLTCWGQQNYINELNNQISIGSLIQIRNPEIKLKDASAAGQSDMYKPWTPTPYELSIHEKTSEIGLLNSCEFDHLELLINVLIREHNDFYT
jgi:hypothetical protein